jgi:hypothetical protein
MGTLQEWKHLRTDALLGSQAVGAPLLRLGFCKDFQSLPVSHFFLALVL